VQRPDISERFFGFAQSDARHAEAIYILGDLFETWVGDDAVGEYEHSVAESLRALAGTGTALYFMHGNRDFLLSERYCAAAGMRLIDQPTVVDLYGVPTVLLHGDTLCTLDVQYQRYRARVTDPDWQRKMLSRPAWFRRAVAGLLRTASRLHNRKGERPETDVAPDAVESLFRSTGVARMIHGHTHRPNRHEHLVDGRACERIVLGDWYEQGSLLTAGPDGSLALQSIDPTAPA
jgi:UDP-2,3-diacylglucosamine hydrolase